METVVKIRIITETSDLELGYWDSENEEFIPIGNSNMDAAAAALNCSVELLETLTMLTESIIIKVGKDLSDIWRRLDAIQKNQAS